MQCWLSFLTVKRLCTEAQVYSEAHPSFLEYLIVSGFDDGKINERLGWFKTVTALVPVGSNARMVVLLTKG